METNDFAKRYLDFWQQSVDQLMRDPHYAERMLDFMQQTQQPWSQKQSDAPANHAQQPDRTTQPSHFGTPADAEPNSISVAELAGRLELCEQRVAVLEAIIRQHITVTTSAYNRPPSGEPETN